MRIHNIFILILFKATTLLSQNIDDYSIPPFTDRTPKAPTTEALEKYSYAPVNLSTGSPNVSIPLHNLSGNDLSLPISLSYRPGVKINETSEYTGHGWTLNAGGVITRDVYGEIDPYRRIDLTTTLDENEIMSVLSKEYDSQPDVFNYNFNGLSGQFVLEDDLKTPYFIKDQRNWIVEGDFSNTISITTDDGIKYVFAEKETASMDYDDGFTLNHDVPIAWYLTEISSHKSKEKIEFNYYSEGFSKTVQKNNTLTIASAENYAYFEEQPDVNYEFSTKKVKDITFTVNGKETAKVVFEANTKRNDINGIAHALSKIKVYDNIEKIAPIKTFLFDIEQVNNERLFLKSIVEIGKNGVSTKNPYIFEYINPQNLPSRLEYKADHWGYYSSNGTEFPYQRQFNWRNAKTKEPSGLASTGSLRSIQFPTGSKNIFDYGNNEYNKKDYEYVSNSLELRWASTNWKNNNSKYSNMEKFDFNITKRQFVELDFTLQLDKDHTSNYEVLRDEVEQYAIEIINKSTNEKVFFAKFDGNGDPDEIDMLVHGNHVTINPIYYHLFEVPNDVLIHTEITPNTTIEEYLNFHSGYIGGSIISNETEYAYNTYTEFPGKFGEGLNRIIYLDLEVGNYEAKLITSSIKNGMKNYSSHLNLELRYHKGELTNITKKAGGIRLNTQYLVDEDYEYTTYYDYKLSDDRGKLTNISSGQITQTPIITIPIKYGYSIEWKPGEVLYDPPCILDSDNSGFFKSFIVPRVNRDFGYSRNPNKPCSTFNTFEMYGNYKSEKYEMKSNPYQIHNSYVNYTEVRVKKGDELEKGTGFEINKFYGLENGYQYAFFEEETKLSFSYYKLFRKFEFGSRIKWPFNGKLILNSLYGKPKSIELYNDDDIDNFKLHQKTKFEYYQFVKDRIFTSKYDAFIVLLLGGTSYFNPNYSLLKSKETKLFDFISDTVSISRTELTYPSKSIRPSNVKSINSDGQYIEKVLQYPDNPDLINQNRISKPIKIKTYKGKNNLKSLISTNELKFSNFNGLVLPSSQVSLKKTGEEQTQITYDRYDASGNLLQYTTQEGITTSIVWGYDGNYVVAKVEGATYDQVLDAMGSVPANGLSETQNTNLRNGLSNAMTTTYEHEPLIGVKSITDPQGMTTNFEYDDMNRLEYVIDNFGNLVKKNEYNYKQIED